MILAAAATGSRTMWYLTRGSGVIALLLLTASLCLGVAGTAQWRSKRMPRFTVTALHRNLTLLAVAFVGVHVTTTVVDHFAPIGWKDAIVPFLSPYRPLWLGLGALASDLLLALVITSLLRVRLGYRSWRFTHWFAYACWPIALVHALGTGSDPRTTWLQLLAGLSVAAVLLAIGVRLTRSRATGPQLVAVGASVFALAIGLFAWYRNGPDARGWASRAGTPASLLHASTKVPAAPTPQVVSKPAIPAHFRARLSGRLTESPASQAGVVDIHVDSRVAGGLHGRLRLVLEGLPIEGGGVEMTASGVAFGATGSSVFEGSIVSLEGGQISAQLADSAGHRLDLTMTVTVDPTTSLLTGTVEGRLV